MIELNRNEWATIKRCLAIAELDATNRLRRSQREELRGRRPRAKPSELAMEASEIRMLREKLTPHVNALFVVPKELP